MIWHRLLENCLRNRRDELVEAMRGAVRLLGAEELRRTLGDASSDDDSPDRLDDWANECSARLDELVEERGEDPYEHGSWAFSYRVIPTADLSVADLRALLREEVGKETGWPAWWWPSSGDDRDPRPYDDGIECWMHGGKVFSDAAHADFWRASVAGEFFLQRGFDDDAVAQLSHRHAHIKPGTVLDPILVIWRVGECLLHAERVATRLESEQVEVLVKWSGLKGRTVASLGEPRFWNSSVPARSDSARSTAVLPAASIGAALPAFVKAIAEPLFVRFDFLDVPESVIATELDRLRGRQPSG